VVEGIEVVDEQEDAPSTEEIAEDEEEDVEEEAKEVLEDNE